MLLRVYPKAQWCLTAAAQWQVASLWYAESILGVR